MKKVLKFSIVILTISLLCGCGDKKQESNQGNGGTGGSSTNTISIDRTENFNEEGILVVTHTQNFSGINYVVNKDMKVLSSYEGIARYVGKYLLLDSTNDKKKHNVLDEYGNVVYSYTDSELKKATLVDNGYLITVRQNDTYNSSETLTGVYSLKEKKYVVAESKDNYEYAAQFGDDMVSLNEKRTKFFNTRTGKIVTFNDSVWNEFVDGYSVRDAYDSSYKLEVLTDEGNRKIINTTDVDPTNLKARQNGYLFSSMDGKAYIFDLKNGTTKSLGSDLANSGKVVFNKDGYALAVFNNQADVPYYTVIDTEGKMLFEPVKCSADNSFLSTYDEDLMLFDEKIIYDGNYFIGKKSGVSYVLDKNNKEVLKSDENETFLGMTNGLVKVQWKKQGYHDMYYYKSLDGKKVSITK